MVQPRQDTNGSYEWFESRRYADRRQAGAVLARELEGFRDANPLVLGIPRGGVPVAAEVASHLDADLDVVVARKLGAPFQPELAIGAITSDGIPLLNEELVRALHVSDDVLKQAADRERTEAQRRERRFRAGLPPLAVTGRTVLLVDDGLATGATMRAAVQSLRRMNPAWLVVAVPVGARDTCELVATEADEVICLEKPEPFYAVGAHYRSFQATSDEEVERILAEHRARRA